MTGNRETAADQRNARGGGRLTCNGDVCPTDRQVIAVQINRASDFKDDRNRAVMLGFQRSAKRTRAFALKRGDSNNLAAIAAIGDRLRVWGEAVIPSDGVRRWQGVADCRRCNWLNSRCAAGHQSRSCREKRSRDECGAKFRKAHLIFPPRKSVLSIFCCWINIQQRLDKHE